MEFDLERGQVFTSRTFEEVCGIELTFMQVRRGEQSTAVHVPPLRLGIEAQEIHPQTSLSKLTSWFLSYSFLKLLSLEIIAAQFGQASNSLPSMWGRFFPLSVAKLSSDKVQFSILAVLCV